MIIQINSDKNIEANSEVSAFVKGEVQRALGRFESQLTRVEVHLSDQNSHKSGQQDKRCQMEARAEGRPPVSVSEAASTLEQAVQGAVGKMRRLLETSYGRLADKR
jgi:hypothetical protein